MFKLSYFSFKLNIGFSYTSGISIDYPEESNRWSKLGTWGDFVFEKHKVTETKYGEPTGYVYYVGVKRMINHYIAVAYQ